MDDWQALVASRLWRELQDEGHVVATEPADIGAVPDLLAGEAAGVLHHERMPFVSYPYEWPFSMLKDAALLQLELNQRALRAGLALKDATPYNVQWRGTRPVFIDIGSFERLRPGEPWAGYRQFCTLFLYPLMLQAYKDLPFHAALRGSLEGIAPRDARAVLAGERFRKGVRLERAPACAAGVALCRRRRRRGAAGDAARGLQHGAAGGELPQAREARAEPRVEVRRDGVDRLRRAQHLRRRRGRLEGEFVREAAARRRARLVWDVGCNDGRYARVAAESADLVVAFDADHATVDALYRRLRDEGREDILPLVMSVTDPSPDIGWRGRERASLERRGTPELVLCLAIVHHVCITGNVPVREFLDWLRSLDAALVIEFPDRADPMVQRLLSGKREGSNPDYEKALFERALEERFAIERSVPVSETRTLYAARPQA